jgi:hypothetical protein
MRMYDSVQSDEESPADERVPEKRTVGAIISMEDYAH